MAAALAGRMLRSTASALRRKAAVEDAFADETCAIAVGCHNITKAGIFTILLVVGQIIVQDQVFNALLLSTLGFLLRTHCHSEARVRWQIDRSCLEVG